MSKIIYQGQALSVGVVTDTNPELGEGTDTLYRDQAGRYYLERCRDAHAGNFRCVHRLSLPAAILWAVHLATDRASLLRQDAAQALAGRRPYLSPAEPNEVTVPLTLPLALYRQVLAMGEYDEAGGFQATVEHSLEEDVRVWLETADQDPTPAEFLARYEEQLNAGEHPAVYPPQRQDSEELPPKLPTSILDLLDAEVGLQVVRYKFLSPWAYTSADVVNGCVEYALGHVFDALKKDLKGRVPDDEGFVDNAWGYVEEEICAFANRRLGGAPVPEKGSTAPVDESDEAPLEIVDLRGTPASNRPDAALCAAGAVESVDEPDEDEEKEADFHLPGDPPPSAEPGEQAPHGKEGK